jgi:hypothetical protein
VAAVIVYGEHVEPPLGRRWQQAREVAGDHRELLLLMTIHGGFRRLDVRRRPNFHFDKTQDVPIPADKIEFAAIMRGAVVAGR